MQVPRSRLCQVDKDTYGSLFRVPATVKRRTVRTGGTIEGVPAVDIWWDRDLKKRADEYLMIRQQNIQGKSEPADVIMIEFSQVYAMIDALNLAVESR